MADTQKGPEEVPATEIKFTKVKSSNIAEVGYDSLARRAHVKFIGGSEYTYEDVPQEAFDKLLNAESVGSHLNKFYKGAYEYAQVAVKAEPEKTELAEVKSDEGPDYGMNVDHEDERVKFILHILGPDEVFYFEDEITALRQMNEINKNVKKIRDSKNTWHDPVIYFPIVYTKAEYAGMDEEEYEVPRKEVL